jgi:hypothetical protein
LGDLTAAEKIQQEKRKTINGEGILFAMTSLGFGNYAEALKLYLSKYREVRCRPLYGKRFIYLHTETIATGPAPERQ